MHILFLAPEVWPYKRVGGLAEVAYDLPRALAQLGHTVGVVTPKPRMAPELEDALEPLDVTLEVPVSWKRHQAEVFCQRNPSGVVDYLIGHEHLFDREGLYGNAYGDYEDNAERFIFYSRACLELAKAMDWQVDVFHANDWTTGLVPVYLRTLYADDPHLKKSASLMSVHNLGNQGQFWHYDMPLTGLGWEYFTPEALEFYGQINFLKGGLLFADMISTVSHAYAQEILTPEWGQGLEGVLLARRDRLAAVVNGIDYQLWDPAADQRLIAQYSQDDLEPKQRCRRDLMELYSLDEGQGRPLAAVVGRLEDRKGLDLITAGMESMFELGFNVVVMGYGEDHYHVTLKELAQRNPGRLGVTIGFDMALAHRIMGGVDMLLVPSRYEPCGIHQMQALRYGAVPVVRDTGGLADTVADHTPKNPGTGFKFGPFAMEAMLEALARAREAYQDPAQWKGIVRRGMAQDFSWQAAAPRYVEIYQKAQDLAGRRAEA
ncbi:MAG: glycogen synthase GlgA [Desulfarculaceae bacterium]|nr:glycogen synthase GlgA [Desulfarculaceae bacterium]MCF8071793.1 glycogen synthase GlgA [Desulfarculaceae bacterium]MCF8101343.1 glycogen synthase GlgA [Desulfarculaceae bacterium]MCF8117196.1 glycogen synthase GlgA [Desulfarculaceae bacterium]